MTGLPGTRRWYTHPRVRFTTMSTLLLAGVLSTGEGTRIYLKAILAQLLLETAWSQTLAGHARARPWPFFLLFFVALLFSLYIWPLFFSLLLVRGPERGIRSNSVEKRHGLLPSTNMQPRQLFRGSCRPVPSQGACGKKNFADQDGADPTSMGGYVPWERLP